MTSLGGTTLLWKVLAAEVAINVLSSPMLLLQPGSVFCAFLTTDEAACVEVRIEPAHSSI